jgi:hypothetical protein
MQIRETHSYTTNDPEDQNMASPTGSTPTDYEQLHAYLTNHVNMVIESLEILTITPSPPNSPKMAFDKVFIANPTIIDSCQNHLTWDDVWEDEMVEWVMSIPYFTVEVHPATSLTQTPQSPQIPIVLPTDLPPMWEIVFPSFEPPALDLFTNIRWQYSPSEYSQNDFGFGQACPYPLGNAAQELMKEIEEAPIIYRSLEDIHAIIPKMQALCTGLHVTVNRAEDSAEFDESDSDSDVSMLNLNANPVPLSATNSYHIARSRGLTISTRGPPTNDSRSAPAPLTTHLEAAHAHRTLADFGPPSSEGRSETSYVRVRTRHRISPDIANRIAVLANSGLEITDFYSSMHGCALPPDETDQN